MTWPIRTASPLDAEALASVHATSFPAPWPAQDLAALIGGFGGMALLAQRDGGVAGFILMRLAGGEGEVLTLAVAPAQRRRGAARALIGAAMAQALEAGADALFLEVAEDNPAAIALYEAHGFEIAGRRSGYYARPDGARIDARILRRVLNTAKG